MLTSQIQTERRATEHSEALDSERFTTVVPEVGRSRGVSNGVEPEFWRLTSPGVSTP